MTLKLKKFLKSTISLYTSRKNFNPKLVKRRKQQTLEKKNRKKSMKVRVGFFEKTNKIDKSLARLRKKKKSEMKKRLQLMDFLSGAVVKNLPKQGTWV